MSRKNRERRFILDNTEPEPSKAFDKLLLLLPIPNDFLIEPPFPDQTPKYPHKTDRKPADVRYTRRSFFQPSVQTSDKPHIPKADRVLQLAHP